MNRLPSAALVSAVLLLESAANADDEDMSNGLRQTGWLRFSDGKRVLLKRVGRP